MKKKKYMVKRKKKAIMKKEDHDITRNIMEEGGIRKEQGIDKVEE